MTAREQAGIDETQASTGILTEEETYRLSVFLQRHGYQPLYAELGIDIRRLRFARWLVQHGMLSEALESVSTDEAADTSGAAVLVPDRL